jgi:hypothetical protein
MIWKSSHYLSLLRLSVCAAFPWCGPRAFSIGREDFSGVFAGSTAGNRTNSLSRKDLRRQAFQWEPARDGLRFETLGGQKTVVKTLHAKSVTQFIFLNLTVGTVIQTGDV